MVLRELSQLQRNGEKKNCVPGKPGRLKGKQYRLQKLVWLSTHNVVDRIYTAAFWVNRRYDSLPFLLFVFFVFIDILK